jgi:hypothetical protein
VSIPPLQLKTIDLTGYTDQQIDSVKKWQKADLAARNKAEALKRKKEKKRIVLPNSLSMSLE